MKDHFGNKAVDLRAENVECALLPKGNDVLKRDSVCVCVRACAGRSGVCVCVCVSVCAGRSVVPHSLMTP